ncbi:MAG: hypothetical protein FWF23_03765 [Alphaproteobacteria bacterium]|nr:hypothetical protein [Alphaproteobacteria bacterium]MCL2504683.1 hypothetical protein [Alphaproteobacteria bacterium]
MEPPYNEDEKISVSDQPNMADMDRVLLKNNIEIFPDLPLPEFDTIGGKAYAARFKTDTYLSLYAVVCTSIVLTRLETIQTMLVTESTNIVKLIASGIIWWADGNRYTVLVWQKPIEPRLSKTLQNPSALSSLKEEATIKNFITSMVNGLFTLQNSGVVHDGINTDTIYWGAGSQDSLQIGECLSFPHAAIQPVSFLNIERSIAQPLGRGPGHYTDDAYAFGIVLAHLLLGRDPFEGKTDAEIISMKREAGSFAAVMQGVKIASSYTEILKGVLADDAGSRITAADLMNHMESRKYMRRSNDKWRKAVRSFPFMGKEYWYVPPLAAAFGENPQEAAKEIENDNLEKWIERSILDEDKADDIRDAVRHLKQENSPYNHKSKLVSTVNVILDSNAPIRYEEISVMPRGIPVMLAEAIVNNKSTKVLSEVIGSLLPITWLERQKDAAQDLTSVMQVFEKMRAAVNKATYGNGIERAVYEGNQSIPCLSPIVKKYYVLKPSQLIQVLEEIGLNNEEKTTMPMDRHIAAFLIAKGVILEKVCVDLSSFDNKEKAVNLLTVFKLLQSKYDNEKLPGLCKWIGSQVMKPILEEYKNLEMRERIQERAEQLMLEGNVGRLFELLDNQEFIRQDREDLALSKQIYKGILKEIETLQKQIPDTEGVMMTSGRDVAVLLSILCSIIIVSFVILRFMFGLL